MQVLELIIFAGLAGVVLYQLYAVLGRRVGRQPEDTPTADSVAAGARQAPAMDQIRSFEAKAEGMRLERFDAFREALDQSVMRLLE